MIKLAILIDTIVVPTAGTEKQLLMLLRDLDRTRFSPHLICLQDSDWMRKQTFDFPVTVLGVKKLLGVQALRKLFGFARMIRKERFDIVQTFFIDANIFGCAAAFLARRPVLVSSRRNIGYWYDTRRLKLLRLLNRRVDYFLANSQAAVASTVTHEHADPARFKVIYNGLDLTRFAQLPAVAAAALRAEWAFKSDQKVLGMVANLRSVKNIDGFIRAAAELASEFNDLRFVVIGEGPQRGEYESLIEALDLKGRFVLPGRSDQITACLGALDMAVLSSHSESFSNSLIEYMAAGLPVVASRVGGNSEAIQHDQTGLLFDVKQQSDLVSCLRRLILDPTRADTMGKAAREEAFRRFSQERSLDDHQSFYTAISRKPR